MCKRIPQMTLSSIANIRELAADSRTSRVNSAADLFCTTPGTSVTFEPLPPVRLSAYPEKRSWRSLADLHTPLWIRFDFMVWSVPAA